MYCTVLSCMMYYCTASVHSKYLFVGPTSDQRARAFSFYITPLALVAVCGGAFSHWPHWHEKTRSCVIFSCAQFTTVATVRLPVALQLCAAHTLVLAGVLTRPPPVVRRIVALHTFAQQDRRVSAAH
jgi:hypothetical protein